MFNTTTPDDTEGVQREPGMGEKASPIATADGTPGTRELKRIIAVAEILKIDPHMARIALQDGTGQIQADCGLSRSVRIVEAALAPDGKRTRPMTGN